MGRDLSRLLRPKSIALFGGNWAENVAHQLRKLAYSGAVWPVNPNRAEIGGYQCYPSIEALPGMPDVSFVGVNREASIAVVEALNQMGAGGATCFASGFLESEGEGSGGAHLQKRLVEAAGNMPFLGPNCYGFVNYLDKIALWPDQHGGVGVERGVGIIAQSSNIAINLTMQRRSLPIAYMVAAGNQAQTGIAEIGEALLADERVTAIGLYLEGFGDIRAFEVFAQRAAEANKPLIVLKIGRSEKARYATMTHTASLAGSAVASSTLLRRLGIGEVQSLEAFLEALKLAHAFGPHPLNDVCSVSCSGGEAGLMADHVQGKTLKLRDFSRTTKQQLCDLLGTMVTIANPLDYHTFIWGDVKRMTQVFEAVLNDRFDLVIFVLDLPRSDRCNPSSFRCAVDAIIAANSKMAGKVAVLSTLPENMPEAIASEFWQAGIVPIQGMVEGLVALDALAQMQRLSPENEPVWLDTSLAEAGITLDEIQSKELLAQYGLPVPVSVIAPSAVKLGEASVSLSFPVAIKGLGIAHKTESGAVVLNVQTPDEVGTIADGMKGANSFLAEEMVADPVAELLIGVTLETGGIYLLTIGSGGIFTELMADTQSMVLPTSRKKIAAALNQLKLSQVLDGYRSNPPADRAALLDGIEAVCNFVEDHVGKLVELDINPLIACKKGAVAVDALIRLKEEKRNV